MVPSCMDGLHVSIFSQTLRTYAWRQLDFVTYKCQALTMRRNYQEAKDESNEARGGCLKEEEKVLEGMLESSFHADYEQTGGMYPRIDQFGDAGIMDAFGAKNVCAKRTGRFCRYFNEPLVSGGSPQGLGAARGAQQDWLLLGDGLRPLLPHRASGRSSRSVARSPSSGRRMAADAFASRAVPFLPGFTLACVIRKSETRRMKLSEVAGKKKRKFLRGCWPVWRMSDLSPVHMLMRRLRDAQHRVRSSWEDFITGAWTEEEEEVF